MILLDQINADAVSADTNYTGLVTINARGNFGGGQVTIEVNDGAANWTTAWTFEQPGDRTLELYGSGLQYRVRLKGSGGGAAGTDVTVHGGGP